MVITGTDADDVLIVEEDADNYTVRAATGTLESVTFAKSGLQSLSIDGLVGNDSVTVDANLLVQGSLAFTGETIVVKPSRSVQAGAKHHHDGERKR